MSSKQPILLIHLTLVLLGSLLIAVGMKINIPSEPVTVSLQSFAVLFLGMIYGVKRSLLAVLIYLAATFAGLPVFIGDLKTNAGYLLGFILAVAITGFLAENGWSRHIFSAMTAALLGNIFILFSGWIVLAHYLDPTIAFNEGVKPFLLADALKILLLAFLVPGVCYWMEKPPKLDELPEIISPKTDGV